MAKLHSKKHGKSGSRKPTTKMVPEWVEYSAPEVEELVLKFAKEGTNAALIGLKLRDAYGIPSVEIITGKSITKIMTDSGIKIEYPDDLLTLIKKAVNMRKHAGKNKQDCHNKTKLIHVESKIKRLVRYYTASKKLPENWKYDPETAELLVK
ncbi:MAG: 30S ribosomal protein S15 [Candidatus Micrarchaeota archaeon]